MLKNNRNWEVLKDFIQYCVEHPEQRFWQALRNWAEVDAVLVLKDNGCTKLDTYYREGK